MLDLLLLRHAKSSWDDPALADHDRPLNRRGRAAAARMGAYLEAEALIPDLALVSSARRTQETWSRLTAGWSLAPPAQTLKTLYLAPPSRLLAAIHRVPAGTRRLLLLGHNPGLEHLAARLAGPRSDTEARQRLESKFPTGALALFRFAATDWRALAEDEGQLLRFVTPKELPD